jgi:hypothetical protein
MPTDPTLDLGDIQGDILTKVCRSPLLFVAIPIASPVLPALIAAAGERAGMRFLEFYAANIRNAHPPGLCSGRGGIFGLVRGRRRVVNRRRAAGARSPT